MSLAKPSVLTVLVLGLLSFETDGQKTCSCYTFTDKTTGFKNWKGANSSCELDSKHLVVMETEKEWEFIKNEINKRQTGGTHNEWHIGLLRDTGSSGNWTWINGKPLTIKKWQSNEPDAGDIYALIHKDLGFYGSFSSNKGVSRAWICEKETDNCQGVCLRHYNVSTTTTTPRRTTTATTEKPISTAQEHKHLSDSTTVATTADKSDSTTVIVAVSLAAVLFIALIALAVVCFLRRKKRHPQDTERPKKKSSKEPEDPYESIDPTEAANLLGKPNSDKIRPESKQAYPNTGCEYAMVNKKTIKQKKGETTQTPPKMDHEYENGKQKKGDLIYAQLDVAEFDDAENDTKVQKPAQYEPTVYADVVPSDVFRRVDPDSTQPTYANVHTTGV